MGSALCLTAAVLWLAGCPGARPETGYPVSGEIIHIDSARNTLLLDHGPVEGVLPALMTEMEVSSVELSALSEGQRVRGTLVRLPDGWRLETIWPSDPMADRILEESARRLREDTILRGRRAVREVGEDLPEFALLNQEGKLVRPLHFRDRYVVMNFIFTRCPDPEMCPASTARMGTLQRLAREEGIGNLELISISLDPEYDTPAILSEYARFRGLDTTNWSFLTGPEMAVRDMLRQFGILVVPEEGLWRHTLSTVLISPEGRILYRVDGSQWDPAEFVRRLPREGV